MLRGSTRNPNWLWPIVFSSSGLLHLALVGLRPWSLVDQTVPTEAPIPIQVVDSSDAAQTAELEASSGTPLPTSEPVEVSPAAASQPIPDPPLQPQVTAPPVDTNAQASVQPPPADQRSNPQLPSPAVRSPTSTPPASQAPAQPAVQPPPNEPISPSSDQSITEAPSRQGGQLTLVGIQADPQGRDLPDNLPRISQNSLQIQPLLSGCGWTQAPAIASTLTLGVTVEATGEISQAEVLQGSSQPEINELVSCLVRRGLRLQPATSAGVAHPTDAAILQIQAEF